MRFRGLWLMAAIGVVSACTGASPSASTSSAEPTALASSTTTPVVTSTVPSTTFISPFPDTRLTLGLQPGIVSASATFEAPDPATHYFDVVVAFPVGTVLRIHFTTADGTDLRIFDEERATDFCVIEAGLMRCLLPFAILEARQAGTWTAVVDKLSEPPVDITIDINWMSDH